MIPILFPYDTPVTSSWTSNGLGVLIDPIDCTVTEERNGPFSLKMTYPVGGHLYDKLSTWNIIAATSAEGSDIQAFRITNVSKPLNKRITVEANHISDDLNGIPVYWGASKTGIKAALKALKDGSMVANPFIFKTDITSSAVMDEFKGPVACKTYIAGTTGSILDVFGGEIEWDNNVVTFWKARGHDSGNEITYGVNMLDLNLRESNDNAYSGVVPFYSASDKGGDYIYFINDNDNAKRVLSKAKGAYALTRVKPLDLTSAINKKKLPKVTAQYSASSSSDYKQQMATRKAKIVSYLRSLGQKELDKLTGYPTLTTTAEFVDLSKSIEYEDMIGWNPVHLCDTVTVNYAPYGLSTKLKINKTVWNVLMDRYDSVTVGEKKRTMSEAIKKLKNQ